MPASASRSSSPPQIVASQPYPVPSKTSPTSGSSSRPCSAAERGEVGVVVLDVQQRDAKSRAAGGRPGPALVCRVQVGDDEVCGRLVESLRLRHGALMGDPALEAAEVTDVGRDEGQPVADKGEGVLQLGTGRQHHLAALRTGLGQLQRQRGVAA